MTEALKVLITAELAEFKKGIKSGKDVLKSFVKEGTKDLGAMKDEFKKYGDASSKFLKGTATAVAGAAAAFLALGPATAELRTNQAKLKTAFETAGGSAKIATDTYNDLYRVLGDDGRAVEAAQHLAKLTTNQKELDQWTKITQGVFATFGDSLPIESLTEAINHTAQLGEVQGSLADALEWAGVNVDDFNAQLLECNTVAEREALIRETLGGLYDEAAEKYEENAADILAQNEAQAKMNEALAELGAVAAPVIAMLAEFAADALAPMMPHIQAFAEKHGPAIKEALSGMADGLGAAIGWIADNWELVSTLAVILGGIALAIAGVNAVLAINSAIMLANPVTWIVAAIVAGIAVLTAAVVLCIKYWDEIWAALQKFWGWIKDNWQGLLLLLINPFAGAFKLIYDNCEGFRKTIDAFVAKFVGFIKENWGALLLLIVNPLAGGFKLAYDNCEGFRKKVDEIIAKIKASFTNGFNAAKDAVKNAIDKIKGFFNFSWSLPKIKTPKLSINWVQEPKWMAEAAKLVGLKGVPKFSVNWNALGGVFDRPTVFGYGSSLQGIGEAGAEAVVPLENNLGWLDKLAGMLNDRISSRPIYLTVDKRVLGQVTADGINDITRRTGKIPLVTM